MSVWLQFDSLTRSCPYILEKTMSGNTWYPNDSRYNHGQQSQTPTNYRVFYGQLNDSNNLRTLGFLNHCRERPENLTYSVEFCNVILPACARVLRPADPVKGIGANVVNIMDEPYIYLRIVDIEHAEGTFIYTNNIKGGDEANFIAYFDKFMIGTNQDNLNGQPPGIPEISMGANVTYDCEAPTIVPTGTEYGYTKYRWVNFKSCMIMPMRLNLGSQEWIIQITDRFGNDIVIYEDDNSGAGYPESLTNPKLSPNPDPNIQTQILLGIKPNYPIV